MSYKPEYKYLPPFGRHTLTPMYDFFCSVTGINKRFREKVLRAVPLQDSYTVADVGCGTGVFLKVAGDHYPHVRFLGFDPDSRALEIAKGRLIKSGLKVELEQAFAESLPMPDVSVDVCFSSLAFHHMPDTIKKKAIAEIHRVLKPGGRVVIADFGETKSVFIRKILFFEKLEYIEGNFRGLINLYLKEAGFRDIKTVFERFPAIKILVGRK